MAGYSPLASAAAGAKNPFGLPGAGGATSGQAGFQGYQLLNPGRKPAGQGQQTGQTPVVPIPINPATTPGAAGAPTAVANTTFNLQTDPALQQVNALAGMSDQQANAQALKERQQALLQYGDPTLAAAVLGQNDPTAAAAGQNQESQLAMLQRERDQNLRQFETQLDPSLTFSGYRVGQEQKLGQSYQDALAQAASGINQGLDSITGSLNSALQQNQVQRENALGTAEASQLQQILAGLGGGGPAGAPPVAAAPAAPATPTTAPGGLTADANTGGLAALYQLLQGALGGGGGGGGGARTS